MATIKKRINITVPHDVEEAVSFLAKRDQVPNATKVAELLTCALELEEDVFFNQLIADRTRQEATWVTHSNAWKHSPSRTTKR